ncbi:MAG: HIT family protein [Nocardioides sp.]|nr:HIT family protein [Nocardioides sp.]
MDCVFCAIVAGDIPSTQVDEDERVLAFMDINPATYGHTLVIPKAHAADVLEIPTDDLTAAAAMGQRIAKRAMANLGADGVNLLNSCKAEAWQTVFHFHLHVIPRYASGPHADGMTLPWTPQETDFDAIGAAAEQLRA